MPLQRSRSALTAALIAAAAALVSGTPHCPAGWSEGGYWCYLLNGTSTLSWAGAQALCSENNGRLAELPDRAHLMDVVDLVRGNHVSEWWIGIKRSSNTTQDDHVNENKITDFFGEDKRPLTFGSEYLCAYLSGRDGFWYWRTCDTAMHYICQRPANRVPIQLVSPERVRPSRAWFATNGRPLEVALQAHRNSGSNDDDDKGEYSANKATMTPIPPTTTMAAPRPAAVTGSGSAGGGSPTEATTVGLCQDRNWMMLDAACYKLVLDAMNWTMASERCVQQGGYLATFRNSGIQQSFVSRFSHLSGSVWFGLRRAADGDVTWVDGSTPAYSGWPPAQPRDPSPEASCGALTLHTGDWANQLCSAYKPFVCRRSLDATSMATIPTTTPTPTAASACGPGGWWLYRQWCFLLVTDRPAVGWQAAQDDCQSRGASLAKIEDSAENANIFHQVTQSNLPVWIGLSRQKPPHQYVWTDSSSPSFTSWEHGRDNMADLSSCVRMDNEHGSWRAVNCNSPQYYVCQRDLQPGIPSATTPPPPASGICPEGWARYGTDRCLLVSDRLADWADARRACRGEAPDGDLVTITDPVQQAFVTDAIRQSSVPLWIGLTYVRVEQQFPTWTDESAVNFTSWAPGQPSNVCDGCPVTCGLLGSSRSHSPAAWRAVDCSQAFRYVCQRSVAPVPAGRPLGTDEPRRCPAPLSDYIQDGDLCIKVVRQPAPWRTALETCQRDNTSLAYVGDVFDNAQLMKLLYKDGGDQYWLALSDTKRFGFPEWSAPWPSEPKFTNWEESDSSQTSASGAPASCAALRPDSGRWRHLSCSQPQPYACVRRPDAEQRALSTLAAGCPSPLWTASETRCYRLHESGEHTRTWAEAKQACEEQGQQLAMVSSRTDFLAVLEAVSGLSTTFSAWIGGYQLPDTGRYVWVDGTPVEFDGWIEGEPSQLRQETCLESSKLNSGRWNNQRCNMYRPYVCMIETSATDKGATFASRIAGGDDDGGSGWRVFGIVCLAVAVALAAVGAVVWAVRRRLYQPRHRRLSSASGAPQVFHSRENPGYTETERPLYASVSEEESDVSGLNGGRWQSSEDGVPQEEHPL